MAAFQEALKTSKRILLIKAQNRNFNMIAIRVLSPHQKTLNLKILTLPLAAFKNKATLK